MGGRRTHRQDHASAPVELPPHVRQVLGQESELLLEVLRMPPPVSIRYNPRKPVATQGSPVPWCEQGRYLEARPVFTLDPLLHAGAYYVQEASSMLLEQAFRSCTALPADAVVLDLCAAPGGKATHLAALLPEPALLIANEPVRARQAALMENLWKWGRPDVVITGAEPAAFRSMGAFCDLVVVDAPCSGEGMFRKDPFARAQWGPRLVESCTVRQGEILNAAWEVLRPGGYLIYSTCTWETCENEDQVSRMLARGAEEVPLALDPAWGVEQSSHGVRCYPHRLQGEGFFLAVIRKAGTSRGTESTPPVGTVVEAKDTAFGKWLKAPETVVLPLVQEMYYAVHRRWSKLVAGLAGSLPVLAPGIPVARRKGQEWVPHAALALNGILAPAAFPALDLDPAEALRYLHGEALPVADAHGITWVRHQGLGLGWANGAGNRWNNKWPAPWRIRMR